VESIPKWPIRSHPKFENDPNPIPDVNVIQQFPLALAREFQRLTVCGGGGPYLFNIVFFHTFF